jgi:hypothetical protein
MADVSGKFFSAVKVRTGVSPSSPGSLVGEPLEPVNPPGAGLSSVGITMPSAFAVANSPLTSNGTIQITGAGTISQYVRGDGTLETFPSLTGFVPYTGATQNVDLGEFGVDAGFVTLDTTPTNTPTSQGTIFWDADDNTVDVVLNGYIMKIGEDLFYPVKNQTGSSIAKGTAVRFAGTVGASGRLLIAPFIADGSVPSSFFMGVTAEAIADGADGKVLYFGRIRGINTNAFNEGDVLYASTTVAGGFQTAVPVAPNNIVQVAAVINKSINQGVIFIRPSFGSNINQDEGVKIVSPTTGQLLQLQANGLWENKTTAQVLGGTSSQFVKGDGTLDSNTYQVTSEKGEPNGYASLDSNGKVPLVQINDALIGNVNFQGLWNASTNTPTLANPPASGTKGYYYIVSTAGSFAGIDFEVGDWIISDGTAWGKVDNTDAVSSVFGRTGNVTAANGDYTTAQVTESGNLYYTDGRARGALSFVAGSGAYNSTTGVITIPTNNNQITNGAGYITSAALSGYLPLTGGILTGQLSSTFKSSTGALLLNSGDVTDAINNRVQIALGYDGSSTYKHYITTTHNDGTPALNRIRFYTSDGLSNGTFPTNAILGLTIENGSISTGGINASGDITGANLSGTNTGDVTISTANGLSLSGQALSLGLASGSANGALSSTDWTTFNNKQAAGNYVTLDTAQTITESKTFSKVVTGGSGDYTNMTSFPIRITGTSGGLEYWRIPFLSNSSTISGVFNFQTGKSVYWGEPDDTGTYFFRGRSFSATSAVFSGNIGISGASATYPLTVYNASNATTAAFGGTARGLRIDNDGVNSVGMTTLFGVDDTFYGSYQPIRLSGSTVHLAIGTSNALTVNAGGNVGIGEINPTDRLYIKNTDGDAGIVLQGSSQTMRIDQNSIRTTTNSPINIFTNNTSGANSLYIENDGRFGIGTTTPAAAFKLDVSGRIRAFTASSGVSPRTDLGGTIIAEGSTRAGLYILTSGTAAGSYGSIYWGNGHINTDAFIAVENNTRAMRFGTADGTRMSILSGGNVLIGTTTDSGYKLNVAGEISLDSYLRHNGDTDTFFGFSGNDEIKFRTAGSDRLLITSGGNVGIGTDSPQGKLEINGLTFVNNTEDSTARLLLRNTTTGAVSGGLDIRQIGLNASLNNVSNGYLSLSTNNTERMRITSGGNLLIGTNSDNGNRLRVNGTIFSNSSVTATSFFESSDATIKTLVEDGYQAKGIDSVVAKLYIKNGKQELGYYAQDLEGVLPSAVSKGSNGLLNLSYREVHTAKIAYLEQRIKQLENELGRLS